MTFIKACPNCSYELDLDSLSIEYLPAWAEQVQCPDCYGSVEVPEEYWSPINKLEDLEAS